MEFKILIGNLDNALRFVNILNEFKCNVDLICGKNKYLDGKSLMGILSCDYSKPMTISIHADSEERNSLISELHDYITV